MTPLLLAAALIVVAVWYVLLPLLRAGPSSTTPICARCGVRPERDAVFCSNCGRELG